MSEMLEQNTNSEEELLNELLGERTEGSSSHSFFDTEEELEQFKRQMPSSMINLWANNDKIIHIVCPPGLSTEVKALFDSLSLPEGANQQLGQLLEQLKSIIQYSEDPGESRFSIVTLKQSISMQEVMSIYQWSYDPKINIHENISSSGLIIQPTMDELRMLYLMNLLLDIREKNSTRVVPATMLPSAIRRAK